MRAVLSLLLGALAAGNAAGDETLRARVALALAVAVGRPTETPPAPPSPPPPVTDSPLTYAQARALALAEGRPLVVWVGTGDVVCPSCVARLTEAVHHFAPTFPGVTGQAIVVAVPESGELVRVADVTQWIVGDETWGHVASVRRALDNWRTRRQTIRGGWSVSATPGREPWTAPAAPAAVTAPLTARAFAPVPAFAVPGGRRQTAACPT